MNKTILSLIIGNEFCERFCFYGLRSLLFVFLRTEYHFTVKNSTRIVHLFVFSSYLFTLFGGLISDLVLGKFKTILYLSLVYFVGTVLLTYIAFSANAPVLLLLSLLMISIGTGGIKPCVAAFGGDQFEDPNDVRLNSFFNFFYFAINVGSMMSMIWSPILADMNCSTNGTCYSLAFGVSSFLLGGSILLFILGIENYIKKEPDMQIIAHIFKYLKLKLRSRYKRCLSSSKIKKAALSLYNSAKFPFAEDKAESLFLGPKVADLDEELKDSLYRISKDEVGIYSDTEVEGETRRVKENASGVKEDLDDNTSVLETTTDKQNTPSKHYASTELYTPNELYIPAIHHMPTELYTPTAHMPNGQYIVAKGNKKYTEDSVDETAAGRNIIPDAEEKNLEIILNPSSVWQTTLDMNIQITHGTRTEEQNQNEIDSPAMGPTTEEIPCCQSPDYDSDFLKALSTMRSFIPVCFFWMIFDQQATAWVEQGSKMNNSALILGSRYEIIPSQMQAFNSVFILLFIPLFSKVVYPLIESLGLILTPLQKISGGIFFGSFSFVLSALLEYKLQKQINLGQAPLSIFWQLPQYLILTMGEIMLNMTGLEFAYSEAPSTMKSVILSGWLLTVAVGNFFVIVLSSVNVFDWIYPKKADFYTFLVYSCLGFAAGIYMMIIERSRRKMIQ